MNPARESKRRWCVELTVFFLLCCQAASVGADAFHAGFEKAKELHAWPAGSRFEIDSSVAHDGAASLKVATGTPVVYLYVPLKPEVKYRAQFWQRCEDVARRIKLNLNFNRKLGGTGSAGNIVFDIPPCAKAGAWSQASVVFVAPPETATCQFGFSFPKPAKGAIWVDDLSISETNDAVTPQKAAPAGPQSSQMLVPAITTRLPAVPAASAAFLFSDNASGTAYASPDIASMISFRCINAKHAPALYMDLPPEVSLFGGMRNVSLPAREPVQRNGGAYVRWKVVFKNPGGWIRLFWKTTLSAGKKATGYYWAEWAGGKQPEQELPIQVIAVRKTRPPRALTTFISVPSDLAAEWPDYADFTGVGFNTLDFWPYTHDRSPWGMELFERILKHTKNTGIRLAAWPGDWWWSEAIKHDKTALAVPLDGAKGAMLCPSYRGEWFDKLVEHGKFLADRGVLFHVFDPEIYREGTRICFCDRCLAGFRAHLRERHSLATAADPTVFEKFPAQHPAEHALWQDYKTMLYAGMFSDYRVAIESHLQKSGRREKLTMMIYSTYHRSGPSFFEFGDYRESPLYRDTLEDPTVLRRTFDIFAPMIYLDVYANYRPYDMQLLWKDISSLQNLCGGAPVAPILSAGYPFIPAYNCDVSPEMMRWQMLETLASGARGFGFWGVCPLDAADMAAVADIVRMILPVENILSTGLPIPPANLRDLSRSACVKGIESKDGAVVLVSEYSTAVRTALVEYRVSVETEVLDLATGQKVAAIAPDRPTFRVGLDKNRARLFFIGTSAKLSRP